MEGECAMLDEFIVNYCKNDIRDLSGFDRTECISVELGHFVMRAYPDQGCVNDLGTVHGGFLLALADMAAAGAADSYGKANATMTVSANFLRSVDVNVDYFDIDATVVHAGRRTLVVEVTMTRPDGKVAFKSTYTMAVVGEELLPQSW